MIAFKSIPHCKLDESLGVKYSCEWFIFLAHTSLPNASLVSSNCLLDTQMSNWNVNFDRYRPSKLFHPQLSPWSSWKRHQMLKLKTRVQSCILSFLSTQVPYKKILLAPTSKYIRIWTLLTPPLKWFKSPLPPAWLLCWSPSNLFDPFPVPL